MVALSVTEGEDKPLKYPDVFAQADAPYISRSEMEYPGLAMINPDNGMIVMLVDVQTFLRNSTRYSVFVLRCAIIDQQAFAPRPVRSPSSG